MPVVYLRTLFLVTALLAGTGACAPGGAGPGEEAPLETEDIGGAIDAELSTEEDQRGPRWVDSGSVLPPGFPADLPLAAGLTVGESGATEDGRSFVVLDHSAPPERLGSDWRSLLVEDGWQVAGGDLRFGATFGDQSVEADITPSGSGSQVRIVYP